MDALAEHGALLYFPERLDHESLREASQTCRGCDLYRFATQTVFGEGPLNARIMMVGEQPGDEEDKKGHPFIGPAGKLLNKALIDAGIDRSTVYVTNAVKHFKWKQGNGKRRLHDRPSAAEAAACRPWLYAELDVIKPEIVVCLGATAAQSLLGASFRVTKERGKWLQFEDGQRIIATVHPSSILRAPGVRRDAEYRHFVADLSLIAFAIA